jgi:DNA replication and repair protein RecF
VLAVGPNGAGKTNLLEAIHTATQGVSPRTRNDTNLVRFGSEGFRTAVEGESEAGPTAIELRWRAGEGKTVRVNGAPVASTERLRSDAATLVFTPDRLAVVKAGPAVRRAYVDRVVSRTHPARASLHTEYGEALSQRNAALRRIVEGASPRDVLTPWDERVAAAGTALIEARAAAIAALADGFESRSGELGLEGASLSYEASLVSVAELESRIAQDLRRGATGAGPHLDEVRIRAGNRELRTHGSQGEQRVAVLALLLAEADVLATTRRVPALLLLDDVLSELDGDRRAALAARLSSGGQVLVTTTVRGALPGDVSATLAVSPGRATAA